MQDQPTPKSLSLQGFNGTPQERLEAIQRQMAGTDELIKQEYPGFAQEMQRFQELTRANIKNRLNEVIEDPALGNDPEMKELLDSGLVPEDPDFKELLQKARGAVFVELQQEVMRQASLKGDPRAADPPKDPDYVGPDRPDPAYVQPPQSNPYWMYGPGFNFDKSFKEAREQAPPALPEPTKYGQFKIALIEKPRPIVEGLLDGASRIIFGGGSKTFKTWAMCDLALSITSGVPWWGFNTFQARCLYVNFELKEYYMQQRLRAIAQAKGLAKTPDEELIVWNLRGYEIDLLSFKTELLKLIKEHAIIMVLIDPFYRIIGGRDERLSSEINTIMAAFAQINRLTAATIAFSAHFTKGNQAEKEAIDRISGGGSINRDPDDIITLTRHEEEEAFSIEFTIRDFPPIQAFVVRWEYPLLQRTDLDPGKLKKIGRPQSDAANMILAAIRVTEATGGLTKPQIEKATGVSETTVRRHLQKLIDAGSVIFSKVTNRYQLSAREAQKWNEGKDAP